MSNFRGYLVRFLGNSGNAAFPNKYLAKQPEITPCQRTEAQAWRDANNNLHRVTLGNHKSKLTLTTIEGIDTAKKEEIETAMSVGLVNATERKFHIEYWNDDFTAVDGSAYRSGYFYLADVTYSYDELDIDENTIRYGAIIYTFIEY